MLIPNGGNFGNRWFSSAGRLLRAAVLFRFGSRRLGRFLVSPKHDDLVVLKELIEAGKVTPVIDHAYPLSETAQALDRVGVGHSRGKVVITVSRAPIGVFASENPIEDPVALPVVAVPAVARR
jgi:NADPH:quinone reductase-like Zn-dependent oxidoreductase